MGPYLNKSGLGFPWVRISQNLDIYCFCNKGIQSVGFFSTPHKILSFSVPVLDFLKEWFWILRRSCTWIVHGAKDYIPWSLFGLPFHHSYHLALINIPLFLYLKRRTSESPMNSSNPIEVSIVIFFFHLYRIKPKHSTNMYAFTVDSSTYYCIYFCLF